MPKTTQKKNTTAKKSTTKKTSASSKTAAGPTHEQIAQKAYAIWQKKGGNDLENWLEAERQLR